MGIGRRSLTAGFKRSATSGMGADREAGRHTACLPVFRTQTLRTQILFRINTQQGKQFRVHAGKSSGDQGQRVP